MDDSGLGENLVAAVESNVRVRKVNMPNVGYRVGLPGWKLAARAGLRVKLRIDVMRDEEAGVFVATSPDLPGLVAEAETLDELVRNLWDGAKDLLSDELQAPPRAEIGLRMPCPA